MFKPLTAIFLFFFSACVLCIGISLLDRHLNSQTEDRGLSNFLFFYSTPFSFVSFSEIIKEELFDCDGIAPFEKKKKKEIIWARSNI